MFLRKNIPETLRPPYDEQIRTPDYFNWDKYKSSGYLHLYSLITQAIIQSKTSSFNVSSIDVAYMPMKTPEYESVPPVATDQLSQQFPFYFMFTFLIPLYYLVSKLAEEKESKSREGMKMMGLKDSSYFLSWFVFFTLIILMMSTIITFMVSINVFPNSSKVLIFFLAFFYGISLFGFSLIIVAILPTVRSSATSATLFHVISYFAVFALKDPDLPAALKLGMSIFPNIGMSFCVYNLYHFEANSTGLSFSNFDDWYNNSAFSYSLLMLIIDSVVFALLGLYLD